MAYFKENFYPPIVETYIPSYEISDRQIRVYFSISQYNKESDIENVQVRVTNQFTNKSVLTSRYKQGIKICQLHKDKAVTTDSFYYIILENSDFEPSFYRINNYYKIQLRFTHTGTAMELDADGQPARSDWVNTYSQDFSEWSKTSLIKPISKPTLYISGLENYSPYKNFYISSGFSNLMGQLDFEDIEEKEKLKRYSFRIINSKGEVIEEALDQLPNTQKVNNFNYIIESLLEEGETYTFEISYETTNGYSRTLNYKVNTIVDFSKDLINPEKDSIEVTPNEELGCMNIKFNHEGKLNTDLVFRRTSSKSNYKKWEDIHIMTWTAGMNNYEWVDRTIESGVFYKYGVQTQKQSGSRGVLLQSNSEICNFEYAFLENADQSLCIKYNTEFQGLSYVNHTNTIETLGSKYPFLIKNGKVDYRTAPISTTLSYLSNTVEKFWYRVKDKDGNETGPGESVEHIFIKAEDLLGSAQIYDEYNNKVERNDLTRISERCFKDLVMEFLNKDTSLKLLRAPSIGNMIVAITDVSLEAFAQEGYVCTLNGTITEIDDYSLKNLSKYNLLNIDQTTAKKLSVTKTGQIQGNFKSYQEIKDTIENRYKYGEDAEYKYEISNFKSLTIDFAEPPQLVDFLNGEYAYTDATGKEGWLLSVDGEQVFVSKDSLPLDLKNVNNFNIIQSVGEDIIAYIQYEVELTGSLIQPIVKNYSTDFVTGQIKDKVYPYEDIKERISKNLIKPLEKNKYRKLLSCEKLKIESTSSGSLQVKDSLDDAYYLHQFENIKDKIVSQEQPIFLAESTLYGLAFAQNSQSGQESVISTDSDNDSKYIVFTISLLPYEEMTILLDFFRRNSNVLLQFYDIGLHSWVTYPLDLTDLTKDSETIILSQDGYDYYGLFRLKVTQGEIGDTIFDYDDETNFVNLKQYSGVYSLDFLDNDLLIDNFYIEGPVWQTKNTSGQTIFGIDQNIYLDKDELPLNANIVMIVSDIMLRGIQTTLDAEAAAIVPPDVVDPLQQGNDNLIHLNTFSGQDLIDNCTLYIFDNETQQHYEVKTKLKYNETNNRYEFDDNIIRVLKPLDVYIQYLYEIEEGEYEE